MLRRVVILKILKINIAAIIIALAVLIQTIASIVGSGPEQSRQEISKSAEFRLDEPVSTSLLKRDFENPTSGVKGQR